MYQTARHDGFLAIVGESGAGKSTLRRDLTHRLRNEPVITIDLFVVGMEANDIKGKTLKATTSPKPSCMPWHRWKHLSPALKLASARSTPASRTHTQPATVMS